VLDPMIITIANYVGIRFLNLCDALGSSALFLATTVKTLFTTRFDARKCFAQMESIGVNSLGIVVLTGTFSGMVFALQSYIGFQRVGGEQFIGAVVALGMIRELGPVFTGLMVTGRAGSAIAAEIGTMVITEQVDALQTIGINPFRYLIVPRILASTIILPFLGIFCMICGIAGGYLVCTYALELNPEEYITNMITHVELSDIYSGLIKCAVFGFIFSWISCYKGFYTHGGARGVGIATTSSVVTSSVLILITNYFLTKLLENL
jgi:phospholipid/cholesterol/gamma-HCH transport system permease protein